MTNQTRKTYMALAQQDKSFAMGYLRGVEALMADSDSFSFHIGGTYGKSEITDLLENHRGSLHEANPGYVEFLDKVVSAFYGSGSKSSGRKVTVLSGREPVSTTFQLSNSIRGLEENLKCGGTPFVYHRCERV